jgi:TonB family protein
VPLPDGVSRKAAPPSAYVGGRGDELDALIDGSMGSMGMIGRGGGGGTGAGYGMGIGRLGGRVSSSGSVTEGAGLVTGSLDKDVIRRIIRRHINEVKYCYQKELQGNPALRGTVVVRFTIGKDGLVTKAEVASTTLKNTTVETCIVAAVRRWLFPKPQGGGVVIVSYPFVLSSGK